MSAKLCPVCGTPQKPNALSCPTCGHMMVLPPVEPPRSGGHRLILRIMLVLFTLVVITLIALYTCCLSCLGNRHDERSQALTQAIGYQEKQFLAERFASPEGIAMYRSMIDRALEQAERRGSSELLGDKVPGDLEHITAHQLSDAYAHSEANADARYRNRTLLVEAQVDAIQNDTGTTPCLLLHGKNAVHDVQACLRDANYLRDDSDLFIPNTKLQLICRGEGNVMNSAVLGDCVPQVTLFRKRAHELKRSCITHVTRGQLFTRLRDTSHPLHYTKPLMLMLRAQYGVDMFPECDGGLTPACELRLQKTHDDEVNAWLYQLFKKHGIFYGA